MHLYFSALPFAPRETELFRRFGHRERADSISVRSGVAPHWDACLQSIGLDSSVKCIAISQDALSIAAGTEKGPIWLIDAATGAPTHQLQGHTRDLNRGFLGTVLSVAFSPDSYRIVSSSRDRTIRLWDAVLFKQLHILVDDSKLATKASEQRTLPNPVPFAAFSPDGKRIAVRTSDKTRLWDPNNAAGLLLLNTFDTALDRFGPVAFSPDGTCFASGSQHGELELLDVSFGTERLVRFRPHVGEISSLAFSPNGARIVSCSHYSPVIKVWDKISNKELFAMYGHEYGVYSVAFSPDGACIVSGSTDNTIRVWDSVSGNALRMLSGHTSGVTSVAFSPDGRHIISGSDDQTVRIWDSALDGGPIDQLAVRRDRRTSSALDISPDGTRVLSSGHLYEVQLRDGLSGKPLDQFTVGSQGYDVDAVSFSPDGAHFVSLNTVKVTEASDGFKLGTSVQMFDVVSGEQLWVSNISLRATNVAFLDDGRHLEVWPNVSGGTGLSGRKSARLEVSKGLEIFSMTDVLTSEPKRLVNSCFSFEKDKNCIVRLTPLPGSVVCYVPRGFRVSKYCFRGNFGVLALESGEIVILEIPQ
jgi:WD40 repeat protein